MEKKNRSHTSPLADLRTRLQVAGLLSALEALATPRLRGVLAATFVDWSLIGLAMWIAVTCGWCWTPPALVVIANRQLALLNSLHEISHHKKTGRLTRAFVALSLSWPLLLTLRLYWHVHVRHHGRLGRVSDPDYIVAQARPWPAVWASLVFCPRRWLTFVAGELVSMTKRERFGVAVWWLAVAVTVTLLSARGHGLMVVLLWVAGRAVLWPILELREMADHYGLDPASPLTYTRNVRGHWLLASLLHPRADGFHLVHHGFPEMPSSQYERAHKILMNDPAYASLHHCDGYVFGRHTLVACLAGRCSTAPGQSGKRRPTTRSRGATQPGLIDLRSDTVTQPTVGMRAALANAVVGGKAAALFVPSGTMANQIALRCLTRPGDEVILDASSHIHFFESAQTADLARVTLNTVTCAKGILTPAAVQEALSRKPRGAEYAAARLLCVENSINATGGRVFPLRVLQELRSFARARRLGLHLDGARVWNACAAHAVQPSAYGRLVDTLSACFAKGLGAPAGSILAGPADAILEARRYRKWYGGALHQSGVLAAAALYGLRAHLPRLSEDHENARLLAKGLATVEGLAIDVEAVETNIILVDVSQLRISAARFAEVARRHGVLVSVWLPTMVRLVTHLGVAPGDVFCAVDRLKATVLSLEPPTLHQP